MSVVRELLEDTIEMHRDEVRRKIAELLAENRDEALVVTMETDKKSGLLMTHTNERKEG